MRIGLSGSGRIGRLFIRKAFSEQDSKLEITVINSLAKLPVLAHLLKFDTVHGYWDAEIIAEEDALVINGRRVPVISEPLPDKIPWQHYGVSIVVDATGKFNDRQGAQQHLSAGAERVIITAPGRGMDLTVVMGVNEEAYDPSSHYLLSAASCTTNCLAPVLHIMDQAFGVEHGWMTTVHSFTNDQNHLDNSHKDLRRARSCTQSIIPTTTGVSKALSGILPHLADRVQGQSIRVPTVNVSLLDLQLDLQKPGVSADDVRHAIRTAIAGPMGKYVDYTDLPLVSVDYVGNSKSAVVDGLSLTVHGQGVKLLAWYDNEWAYTCRVYDLAHYVAHKELQIKEADSEWNKQTVLS
ncbi:glyceraldehyde-3-phosphate dehydrogenase [Cohnella kolymensis]|uniref:Glyceraldehyde-3-phosphate dehydrogenase n=1 Tax=Cohnella kolymensis TaxID=1590652 RepID=A0ABR5A3S7_9BACL|nr:type I glyceraldehyde-3-phosphate dehydrogenase [Cohnella kolymensis]KIL35646.1 glyceraldehyde-3-phosphate dehydrogenase [Cohnella kolymensis]